ncbi:MAG: hypothetical protein HGA65_11115 [Oscillochloris sp.]|nr:hypothetical protein [Oscillochloris sp.]
MSRVLEIQGDTLGDKGQQLSDALAQAAASCREYPLGGIAALGDRLAPLARRNAERASWLRGIAQAFFVADSATGLSGRFAAWGNQANNSLQRWSHNAEYGIHVLMMGSQPAAGFPFATHNTAAWNITAHHLLETLQRINERSDYFLWLDDSILRDLILNAIMMTGMIRIEDEPRWATVSDTIPLDLPKLLEQAFWNLAVQQIEPDLLLALSIEIEQIQSRISADRKIGPHVRPSTLSEQKLPAATFFPGARCGIDGALIPAAWSTMAGDHSAISPFYDEQVTYRQIGAHDHEIAICGLDLENMHVAPNGLMNVILTADSHDPMENSYYRLVKERFLRYLDHIPPGDSLNVVGHSMGGGMSMLLLNDPEIQARLMDGGYNINSITTYGAVRPTDPRFNGFPPSEPSALIHDLLGDAEVRFYVDPEDRLAMNVGAGHLDANDEPLPHVILIDNGHLDGPTTAHTSYEDPAKYVNLPPELADLPFRVDPRYLTNYRNPDDMERDPA